MSGLGRAKAYELAHDRHRPRDDRQVGRGHAVPVTPVRAPLRLTNPAEAHLRAQIAACDAKIARYKAALDAGGDPAIIAGWITTTQAERAAALAQLRTVETQTVRKMSRQEIADLITRLGDIATTLRRADPDDKAEVYRHLGLHLSYDPNRQIVRAEARGETVRVEGGT